MIAWILGLAAVLGVAWMCRDIAHMMSKALRAAPPADPGAQTLPAETLEQQARAACAQALRAFWPQLRILVAVARGDGRMSAAERALIVSYCRSLVDATYADMMSALADEAIIGIRQSGEQTQSAIDAMAARSAEEKAALLAMAGQLSKLSGRMSDLHGDPVENLRKALGPA